MKFNKHILRLLALITVLVFTLTMMAPAALAVTPAEIHASVDAGLAWLATQQNATSGSWGSSSLVAHTALAVLKFEHHAVFGLGISPFDEDYIYHTNVEKGLDYLFSRAVHLAGPLTSSRGDPDPDDDGGILIYQNGSEIMYEDGAAMMAIAASNAPGRVVNVAGSYVNGWQYSEVLQEMVDAVAYAQEDDGSPGPRGGWRYVPEGGADNSVSGYPTLGLGYAQAPAPWGFGLTVPAFVKTELSIWIDYIQNDASGGSGYDGPGTWVNVYKTGNLLYEMALVGDTLTTPRVQQAINYLVNNWNAAYTAGDFSAAGWKDGPTTSLYHGTFTMMKGLEAFGIGLIGGINWYGEFANELLPEQTVAGNWPYGSYGGDTVLETAWALLTLQRAVPPPNLSLTPVTATNYVGTSHTLTATLVDNAGAPVPNETITFTVILGPHMGQSGTGVTNANGQTTWSYTGASLGLDRIQASGAEAISNHALKLWETGGGPGPEVGGDVYPVNKAALLAPWIALVAIITGTAITMRRRRSQS